MTTKAVKRKPRLNHRFRFQLLHKWLTENFHPCKAADIGGGKGVLAFLLNNSGWGTTVIDPFNQLLPRTFKDLKKNRITLPLDKRSQLKIITKPFEEEMAKDFDLLIGLYSRGSNLKIINASKKYRKSFVLLPCCVVDEPITVIPNINWFDSLVDYAKSKGFNVQTADLNFKGQNQIIYVKSENSV